LLHSLRSLRPDHAREAAYLVVARRRKGVSAHSSAARRRAIRCHAGRIRTWTGNRSHCRASVDKTQHRLAAVETGHLPRASMRNRSLATSNWASC